MTVTFVSFRKAPFVIPRYPWNMGLPGDALSSRAMFYCHHKYIAAIHASDQSLKAATNTPLGRWLFRGHMGLGDAVMGKVRVLLSIVHRFGYRDCPLSTV